MTVCGCARLVRLFPGRQYVLLPRLQGRCQRFALMVSKVKAGRVPSNGCPGRREQYFRMDSFPAHAYWPYLGQPFTEPDASIE